MADTLFCLDISADAVTGVLVEKSSKATVVTGCGHIKIADQSLEIAIEEVCKLAGFSGEECHLSLGVEFFSFRNLSVPFTDRKKIAQILPMELDNLSVGETESIATDFLVSKTDEHGAQVVAAGIEKVVLTTFLDKLAKLGLNPTNIEIRGVRVAHHLADFFEGDCILLDINDFLAGLIVVSGHQITLIRCLRFDDVLTTDGKSFGGLGDLDLLVKKTLVASQLIDITKKDFTVFLTGSGCYDEQFKNQISSLFEVEVRPYLLIQQPLVKIALKEGGDYFPGAMDPVFALALKANVKSRSFNFRKEEFKKRKSTVELRNIFMKATLPIALIILAGSLYFGLDYKKNLDTQKELQEQIAQIFSQALPDVKRIVNPLQQLQVEINEIRKVYSGGTEGGGGYTILSLLTEISNKIPSSSSVTIKRMVADKETVRLKGVTKDFNTVDTIQKELEKAPFFQTVTISSASQSGEGDEVLFELRLDL